MTTKYIVRIEVEVEGPEWPDDVPVPKRLLAWDAHILNEVHAAAATAIVNNDFREQEIEVVFE